MSAHRLRLYGGAGIHGTNPPVVTEAWCACGRFLGYGDETRPTGEQQEELRRRHHQHVESGEVGP